MTTKRWSSFIAKSAGGQKGQRFGDGYTPTFAIILIAVLIAKYATNSEGVRRRTATLEARILNVYAVEN